MASESSVFGYFLPNAVLSQIFSEYLSFKDISQFDVAMCSKSKRPEYLDCIGSEFCILLGDKKRDFNWHAMSWLHTRSLRVNHLKFSRVTYDTAVKISSFGSFLYGISIQDVKMVNKSLAKIIRSCTKLRHMTLAGCWKITDVSIGIPKICLTLKSLDLSHCEGITDASLIGIADKCPNLQSLKLFRCGNLNINISDKGIIRIAEKCPKLQYLGLKCRFITDASIIRIGERCPSLRSLDLTHCKNITDASIIRVAEGCPNLQSLNLSCCGEGISDESIIRIAERCPNLHSLDLSYVEYLTNASIIRLAEGCPDLQSLNLSCCGEDIKDDSIIRIAERCPNLHSLDLTSCYDITDVSIIRVAEVCPNLHTLSLNSCPNITEMSILRIAEGCLNLQNLNLGSNDDFPTDDFVEKIREKCLKLKVFRYY